MPFVDGQGGDAAVRGAISLLGLLMVLITVIVVTGKPVPDFLITTGTLLTGFLVGTRVVSSDVSREIARRANPATGKVPPSSEGAK